MIAPMAGILTTHRRENAFPG